MLQAEILVQYGMRNKAVERLQRIQELFPREEERNEDLQRLYLSAGMTPPYAGAAPALSPRLRLLHPRRPGVAPPAADPAAEMRNFTRVAEITRKLYHQATAAAFDDRGQRDRQALGSSRCVAAMCTPGSRPTCRNSRRGAKAGDPGAGEYRCVLQDFFLSPSSNR